MRRALSSISLVRLQSSSIALKHIHIRPVVATPYVSCVASVRHLARKAVANDELDMDIGDVDGADFKIDTSYISATNPPKLGREHYEALGDIFKEEELQRRGGVIPPLNIAKDSVEAQIRAALGIDTAGATPPPPTTAPDFLPDLGELDKEADWTLDMLQQPNKINRPNKSTCIFCRPETRNRKDYQLVYTNVNFLLKLVNERGMIVPRRFSKCCAKHQRKVAEVVKQSRRIGLLSFSSNWRVPASFKPEAHPLSMAAAPYVPTDIDLEPVGYMRPTSTPPPQPLDTQFDNLFDTTIESHASTGTPLRVAAPKGAREPVTLAQKRKAKKL